jgi:hypothetical protein
MPVFWCVKNVRSLNAALKLKTCICRCLFSLLCGLDYCRDEDVWIGKGIEEVVYWCIYCSAREGTVCEM